MQRKYDEVGAATEEEEDGDEEDERSDGGQVRFYVVWFVFSFVVLFSLFSFILWAASLAYKPGIMVQVKLQRFGFYLIIFVFFPFVFGQDCIFGCFNFCYLVKLPSELTNS